MCRLLKEEDAPKLLASTEAWEASSAYGLAFAKLCWLLLQGRAYDALLATMLLGMPGIADHFPGHYQEALEEVILEGSKQNNGHKKLNSNDS